MEITRSVDAFLDAPSGRCLLAEKFAYWSLDPELWGMTVWGHIDRDMVRFMTDVIRAELGRALPPYAAIVDMRGVTGVEVEAFARWAAFLHEHRVAHTARVRREVVVRPVASFAGALVTGYGKVVQPEHPFVVVSSVPDAIAWLERPDAADVVEDMASLVNGDLLAAMRASLVHPFRIDRLDAMAAHLRVSARTLQRRLAQVGTSFQAELARARVKAAQGMLLSGDDKISAVAREVGFATQAHFTRVFRELTGLPPGEWRARERAARER